MLERIAQFLAKWGRALGYALLAVVLGTASFKVHLLAALTIVGLALLGAAYYVRENHPPTR